MTTIQRKTAVGLIALIFTLLFFNQKTGLNLLLFEGGSLIMLRKEVHSFTRQKFGRLIVALWTITAATSFIVHSPFAIVVHVLMSLILIGSLNYEQVKNVITPIGTGIINLYHAPQQWIKERKDKSHKTKLPSLFIFVIPVVVIFAFLIIYSFANKIFGDLITTAITTTFDNLGHILEHMNSALIFTIVLGIVVGSALVYRHRSASLSQLDQLNETLERQRINRKNSFFHPLGLQHEYIAGIFLLISLNVLITILNIIDITHVWFGFHWKGEDFASMVHEGTALLIIAVLASIGVVLYYFRNNQNFYDKPLLRVLALIWILQNGVLAISVMMRNAHYVDLFSLSHKRIGVFIFLLMVFIGLITVWFKIKSKKTAWFLFKTNSLQVVIILCAFTTFHWDKLIARYNFSRGSASFVYLSHLAQLDDAALPYLEKSLAELEQLSYEQYNNFNFREKGLTPIEYYSAIATKKLMFIEVYKQRDWRSWNIQNYITFKKLNQQ
jgi:hypothetical protein